MAGRHIAIVSVPTDLMGEVLLGTARVHGFPPDAKFIQASYDFPTDSIFFMLEHPSFLEVLPGEKARELFLGVDYVIAGAPCP